ncbi:MAG: hypothetical protein NTU85_03355 [Candidatus Kaiserbacteria bacterium]|nr:hypothetical protein [Candidatus Kaiserbacteria bacterium]
MKTYLGGGRAVLIGLAVIFASAGIAQATTAISTSITTGGALTVSGQSSLGQATSTMLSAYSAYFGGTATSTFGTDGSLTLLAGLSGTSGLFSTTLGVTGKSSLDQASTTILSANSAYIGGIGSGATTTISAGGNLSVGGTLQAGSDGTAITHMVVGYCDIASASVTASTTAIANCTTSATISTLDRVFVTATDTLDNFIIEAASSTSASNIQVRILNTGMSGTATFGNHALSFWAIH